MNHKQLLGMTVGLAEQHGLMWHYCPDSRHCLGARGFPDLVVAGPGGLVFVELKSADDDTTAEQDFWRYILYRAGVRYQLFRPSELTDGTIRRVFERLQNGR